MIDILRTKFIRIEKEEFNTDEKDFQFISTDAIIIIDDEADEADKDDQSQEYLFSSTSSSLRDEKQAEQSIHQSNTFSFSSNTTENIENIENIRNRSILDSSNILFTDTSCTRKSTRKAIHNSALIETSTNSKEIFYAAFSISLIIVASKDIKLHKNNLSSKSKYYKDMIKHPLASEFVQAIFTKIEVFQSKDTWK